MPRTIKLDIKHVTRLEGHGNLVVRATDGHIEKAEWQVPEAPRFFEAMVRGRRWDEIQGLVSRICGICSISHSLVAIKAVEDAFAVQLPQDVVDLRRLTHYSEMFQSHVLHIGYLVAPDLFGVKSVVGLLETHLDVVKKVIALHGAANGWSDLLAGRTTHPLTLVPGGFTQVPSKAALEGLRAQLIGLLPLAEDLAQVVLRAADALPDFTRETEYVALQEPGAYAFYGGDIASSDIPGTLPVSQFESVVNEYVTPQSTAKWARWHRPSYAVGALARYNLNSGQLLPLARKWAGMFGLNGHCANPYFNSVAQLVECAQVLEDSLRLLDYLLGHSIHAERVPVRPRKGNGAAGIEAPRGVLFHRYQFDEQGICVSGNLSIPTNQNHGNIQQDLEAMLPDILDLSQDEIKQRLELLVRSYDPCISCSTHHLNITFV